MELCRVGERKPIPKVIYYMIPFIGDLEMTRFLEQRTEWRLSGAKDRVEQEGVKITTGGPVVTALLCLDCVLSPHARMREATAQVQVHTWANECKSNWENTKTAG